MNGWSTELKLQGEGGGGLLTSAVIVSYESMFLFTFWSYVCFDQNIFLLKIQLSCCFVSCMPSGIFKRNYIHILNTNYIFTKCKFTLKCRFENYYLKWVRHIFLIDKYFFLIFIFQHNTLYVQYNYNHILGVLINTGIQWRIRYQICYELAL